MTSFKALRKTGHDRRSFFPCFITLINAFLGFIAIITATRQEYSLAALCIATAACMDVLDGSIARALNGVTTLGMELDSLSDAISFCLAPAIMFYCWCGEYEPINGLGVSLLYLAAGLIRLARFNALDSSDTLSFRGLPTPAAALSAAFLMINYTPTVITTNIVSCGIVLLALLMISSLRFPSLKQYSIKYLILLSFLSITIMYCMWLIDSRLYVLGFWLPLVLYIGRGITTVYKKPL